LGINLKKSDNIENYFSMISRSETLRLEGLGTTISCPQAWWLRGSYW